LSDTLEDRKHAVYFAEELTARRKELGLNRLQAAEKAGLTYGTVTKLEKGLAVSTVEYRALVAALDLQPLDTVTDVTVDGDSWGGLKRGDPVILVDDPKTPYEFRRYNPPEARGGEYVEVVEIENRRVRRTRPVHPYLVCHYNGIGVDQSDEAEARRKAISDDLEQRAAARKEAWLQRRASLEEVED
jgi:transcriptional regulator with XRE-family HTH domain